MCASCSVVSDSLRPRGLRPSRLLCPWDSPGKNTGVGCHFLLQAIFTTQGLNPGLPHCGQTLYCLSRHGSPHNARDTLNNNMSRSKNIHRKGRWEMGGENWEYLGKGTNLIQEKVQRSVWTRTETYSFAIGRLRDGNPPVSLGKLEMGWIRGHKRARSRRDKHLICTEETARCLLSI